MACDIAFALGGLALIGPRAPATLKVLFLTLAIVDDLGAIAVIALFYSHGLAPAWLLGAAAGIGGGGVIRRRGIVRSWWYLAPALVIWTCMLESGIHATIAGVALGLARLPSRIRARHVVGLGLLGGIGFTVSLFVADLSFAGPAPLDEAKLGILVASLVSGLTATAVLALGRGRVQTSGQGTE